MPGSRIFGALRSFSRTHALSKAVVRSQYSATRGMAAAANMINYEVKDGVAVLTINDPTSKVNSINERYTQEVEQMLDRLASDPAAQSAVLISGKPECFIAGADINMLASFTTKEQFKTASLEGHRLMNKIEGSSKPIVAAIMGSCMGGGLEVALACHYRVAVKSKKTSLSLPEVMLGLLPGAGGTQRLPKLVSIPNAFDMMLTGKNIKADKAKKMGLVDSVVDSLGPGVKPADQNTRDYLEQVAIQTAKGLANGSLKRVPKKKGFADKMMDKFLTYDYGKNFLIKKVTDQVMKASGGLYPAPLKIIDVVKTTMTKGSKAGYEAEAENFSDLGMTPESEALVGLFHGTTACKKNNYGTPAKPTKSIAVLGAGLMGAGVAQVSIDKGYSTILKDMADKGLANGYAQIDKGFKTAVKKRKITSFEKDMIMSNLKTQLTYANFDKVDMVIEAVFEDIDIKHKVIKEVEQHISPDCIFASNTSALPISKIAEASKRPDKVIGMHYFSPVDKMQLLEIITTDKTSKDTVAAAVSVGLKQGKNVIVVKDGPGFYTTRCIAALGYAALDLIVEVADPELVNKETKKMGFPLGLGMLQDEVGIDVGYHITNYFKTVFGDRLKPNAVANGLVDLLMESNALGRKTGKGVFLYEGNAKGPKPINPMVQEYLTKNRVEPKIENTFENNRLRIVGAFTNEAVMCMQEGIIDDPLAGDVGLVFGTGFPANLGGPFRFVDMYGAQKLVDHMDRFADAYGPLYEPCQLLRDHAKDSSKRFHKK